ncbi:MAG: hypothetical protein AB7V07_09380 [Candidatus Delongbacteria bacterium]
MIFLLIITLPLYYLMKGVILKETKVMLIITSVVFGINLLVLNAMDGEYVRTIGFIYVIYTFTDYLTVSFTGKPIWEVPYMSVIRVINKEVTINYSFFKPLLLIPFNLYLILRRQPCVGMKDDIGVDITAKDGTVVKIKL